MNPIHLKDVLKYRFLSQLSISSNGKTAAFLVRQADESSNRYRSDIHLLDLEDGRCWPLTESGLDGGFQWEAAGQSLLFTSGRPGPGTGTTLYRTRPGDSPPQPAVELPDRTGAWQSLADGRFLYAVRRKVEEAEAGNGDCIVAEEIPFWQEGIGFCGTQVVQLLLFDPASGRVEQVTPLSHTVQAFDVLGTQIAYTARRVDAKGGLLNQVWHHDLATRKTACLSDSRLIVRQVAFLDADRLLWVGSDTQTFGVAQNPGFLVFDLAARTCDEIAPRWDRSFANSVQSDCRLGGGVPIRVADREIYAIITEGTRSKLIHVRDGGEVRVIAEPDGSVDDFDVVGDCVLTVELHSDHLQEVYRYADSTAQRLTSLNRTALEKRDVSIPEAWRVAGPVDLDAWILKPHGFDETKTYPAVLMIHGGPRAIYGRVLHHDMQVLAGEGYVVICCNPRGSSGRGNAFAEIRGKYGNVDYDDLMRTVDAALERYPFIDPDRLGVMGGSYGGFMVNWIIGHTGRFKAAVACRSSSNYLTRFLLSDMGFYLTKDLMTVDPWDGGGAEKLWHHSPVRYANKVETPTLFIHGDHDFRCGKEEALQMFTALRYHDVKSRLVLFRGEGHGLPSSGRPLNRIRRLEEILVWFKTHLKSR